MDAFEIYGRFVANGWTPSDKDIDGADSDAVHLARLLKGDTVQTYNTEEISPHQSKISMHIKNSTENYRFIVDTDIAQRSRPRIQAFLRSIGHVVSMKWVKSFASRIEPVPEDDEVKDEIISTYETYDLNSDRHTHIVQNDVIRLLNALYRVDDRTVTSFAFSHNSTKAIHLQRLDRELRTMFRGVSPTISLIVIGSVGLPMHELFKPNEFIDTFRRGRFKNFSAETIIKITLRDKLTINKMNPRLETSQLLEKYEEEQAVFKVTNQKYTQPQTFMLKTYYSYPSTYELLNVIAIAEQNLQRWCD
jgi:hypothetical protein